MLITQFENDAPQKQSFNLPYLFLSDLFLLLRPYKGLQKIIKRFLLVWRGGWQVPRKTKAIIFGALFREETQGCHLTLK